jgi:hypothetical protein
MTSLPERNPKKTTVPSILALLSNGCKQAFPLLTVDLQRARHNIKIDLKEIEWDGMDWIDLVQDALDLNTYYYPCTICFSQVFAYKV